MKLALFCKMSVLTAGVALMVSCSKSPTSAGGQGADGASAFGLGKLSGFSSQQAGETYTTRAPHNQVYLFPFDNSTLDEKYMPSLKAQAVYLKQHPGAHVMLAGHTDERGSREYNIALGERRANTVAQILRMSGVPRSQMRVVSYGKERPVVEGHDEIAYRQNRRVVFTYEAIQ